MPPNFGITEAISDSAMHDRIAACRDRLNADRLRLLVVGEFNRGKSTFVNALVGCPLLPTRMVPTTAVLTVVRGGVQPACKVVFRDGTTQALSLPNLKINHFLDEYLTATNADANRIKEVQIRIPGRLQSLDADIVDTPGVNDIDVMREEVTFQHLKHADAVIVILDAQQPVSQSEREFLSNHVKPSDVSKMLFVLNRIDERIATVDDCSIESVERYAEERLRTLALALWPELRGELNAFRGWLTSPLA